METLMVGRCARLVGTVKKLALRFSVRINTFCLRRHWKPSENCAQPAS